MSDPELKIEKQILFKRHSEGTRSMLSWWLSECNEYAEANFDIRPTKDNLPKYLMYLVTEASEAMNAWRDGNYTEEDGVFEEFADIAIRLFDVATALGCDLECEMAKKMVSNWKREYNHGRANI